MPSTRLRAPAIILLIVALAAALASTGTAQDTTSGTPTPTGATQYDLAGAIYMGPCDALNMNPQWSTGEFIEVDDGNLIGYDDVGPILRAEALVDTSMDDLFRSGGAYSFVATDNTDPDGDPVACGRLGGVLVNGQVAIALYAGTPGADNDSPMVGMAIFGRTATTDSRGEGELAGQADEAQLPDAVPVQAYLFPEQLDGVTSTEATPTATMAPLPPTNTPVPPTNTPVPPTNTPEPTAAPTEAPTEMPTEMPPTEVPPTEVPPTEVPPTEAPPTEAPTMESTEAP